MTYNKSIDWAQRLRDRGIPLLDEMLKRETSKFPPFDYNELYHVYIIVRLDAFKGNKSLVEQKKMIVKWGIASNSARRFYAMQESNVAASKKFDVKEHAMLVVKRIDANTVKKLDVAAIKSTYECALVYEWLIERMRGDFTPYKDTAIAGCASILNDLYLTEAKRVPQPLFTELIGDVECALQKRDFVQPRYVPVKPEEEEPEISSNKDFIDELASNEED